jgi:chemotaxis protein MotB
MQTAFSHEGIFDPHAPTPPITDAATPAVNAAAAPIALPIPVTATETGMSNTQTEPAPSPTMTPQASAQVVRSIEQVVRAEVARRHLDPEVINLHRSADGLVISLREAGFFASGSADIRESALSLFEAVAAALPHQAMRVEGHTDNIPIHTQQFATNWELSTARAATITRLLIHQNAVDPAKISATGYAEFRPTAGNDTEAGRAKNRRVDIVLLDH